jgi:hypothetical protein
VSADDDAALTTVLRRALALVRTRFSGDLHALVGEALDHASPAADAAATSLAVLRAVQQTLQPGEPFGDPAVWARRASVEELRRVLEATLLRLQGSGSS